MTDCIRERLSFPRCKGRRVEARFVGGAITSNGGAVLQRRRQLMDAWAAFAAQID